MQKKNKVGRPEGEKTKAIRVKVSKLELISKINTEPVSIGCSDKKGVDAKCEDLPERMPFMNHIVEWCNSQTEKGICFLCGKRFNAKRNPCKCGTENCKIKS